MMKRGHKDDIAGADEVRARQLEGEREHLLRELRAERGRLQEVFRRAPAFIAVLRGPDFVFEMVNDAYYQLVGPRELIGRPVFDALPEVRGQGFEELLNQVLETGEPFVGREMPVTLARSHPGQLEERFVDFIYAALTDADGARWGVMAHGTDVTEHVRARREVERLLAESEASRAALEDANEQLQEQTVELEAQAEELQAAAAQLEERTEEAETSAAALKEHERQLRRMVDAIPTLAWTARPDGFIDWYNARWYEYTGTTPDDMTGWGWQSVHDPDTLPLVLERWLASIATGQPFEMTFPLRGADGRLRPFLTRVSPVTYVDGKVVRWFGTNTDVEAERLARSSAEEANQAKSSFLATMSHELRTPLNAIGGYAELLDLGIHGPVTDPQREVLARIQRSQRHLLGLINDVLNFAKLEAGHVEYRIRDVSVREAVDTLEPLVAPQLRAKGLTFDRQGCMGTEKVRADHEKLQQILLNLVSNAIKFTPDGGRITLMCEARGEDVRIGVTDTGIGIPSDRLEDVFAPFVQIERRLNAPHEGTGLGLAISRDLARGMAGDLTGESTPDVGSTFTLVLPRCLDGGGT